MVVALLSERRGDPIGGTGQRARRLLAQFTGALAQQLAACSPAQTRDVIETMTYDDRRYLRWRAVFCRPPDAPWSESDFLGIAATDALQGWTVSNVLRRSAFGEPVARPLREMYRAGTATAITRWRIVHALGRSLSSETLDLLAHALGTDDEFWVRFGAVRSIVEVAAQTDVPRLRARAFEQLATLLSNQPDTIADMAAWTAMYEGTDAPFQKETHALFAHVQGLQTTDAARDRWGDRISDLSAYWEGRRDHAFFAADPYGRKE